MSEPRRVIIPAAGRGNRLRPITDAIPKALVEVDGKPLLVHSLEKLSATGRVADLVLVVGHLGSVLEECVAALDLPFPVRFVRNAEYDRSNSIFSLWLTRSFWSDGFVLLDSDIHYDAALLSPLFDLHGDCMIIDTSRTWAEIDMKVTLRDGRVWHLDKGLGPEETQGEFFGMSFFSPEGAAELSREISSFVAKGETGVWYEHALREVAKRFPIASVPTSFATWCEIDTEADLHLARAKIAQARKDDPSRG